jgi:DNA end-binding protein Ku
VARALWKGAISFGLVTIPVALYTAKSTRDDIAFHMLHKDDLSRIRNKRVDEEDHEVAYEDVVRGYEYEKDQYVVIDEDDLRKANVEATQTIDIMHFVDGSEIDIAYYNTPYYTEPTKAGRKAYALLRETLKRTGKVGVAKIVIRERQHLCAVIADGPALLAYTLRWPYQLREATELELPGEDLEKLNVSPQELKMAEQLVEAMATPWEPAQYTDTYHDDLLRLIDEKVKTGTVSAPGAPRAEAPGGKVVDIMTLLKRSMERQGSAPGAAADAAGGVAGAAPKTADAAATAGDEDEPAATKKSSRSGRARKAG